VIDLGHRANILYYDILGKPLLVYEDHRTTTFVLWHAMHVAHKLEAPPLLLYFDRHDDAKQPQSLDVIRQLRQEPGSKEKVHEFVEWGLSVLDDDWLIAAMELGLVGDAINIGADDTPNLPQFETIHTDHLGVEHRIWALPHLWHAFDYQQPLSDTAREAEFRGIWDALRWEPGRHPPFATHEGAPPVVLDFDLDFLAGHFAERIMAWPSDTIHAAFTRMSTYDRTEGWSAARFLEAIEPRVAFRTVARESDHCGGTEESQSVLAALDAVLWYGELFRPPVG
jgi:hypothetical protein